MGFLEGSKAVSTSIGGSQQTINFNPVLNARGATSGGTVGGLSKTDSATVTNTQSSGSENPNDPALTRAGYIPELAVDSSRPSEAISYGDPNYLSQSGKSFQPGQLGLNAQPGEAAFPWLAVALAGGLIFFLTR